MEDRVDGLQSRIDDKIRTIGQVAQELPCVVIVHNVQTQRIEYLSPFGLEQLELSLEEVKALTSEEYHERYFNAEDAKDYVPKIFDLVKRNNDRDIISFFQQMRPSVDQDFQWHFSTTKILMRDDEGKSLLIITMAYPVDPEHHITTKISRLLEENNFLRKNFRKFDKLTNREREILKLTALGKSSVEMAKELYISQNTAETHRRNIKKKLKAESMYDLSMYARAFDLI